MTDRPVPSSRAADEEPGDSLLSASNSASAVPSDSPASQSTEGSAERAGLSSDQSARRRRWPGISPFFLSAALFLSGFFAVFSPLPLILQAYRAGFAFWFLALLTNAGLVYWLGGLLSLWLFLIFGISVALALPWVLRPGRSPSRAAAGALGFMLFMAASVLLGHAWAHHVSPWEELRRVLSAGLDQTLAALSPEGRESLLRTLEPEEWKREFLLEFPSAMAIFGVAVVGVNLVLLLRINPGGLRQKLRVPADFFKQWKTAEWLVWPTIVCAALQLLDGGWATTVGMNGFKFLMSLYAIQGISILAFLLEAWGVRGPLRFLIFTGAVLLMLPLVLSLGFFDLWFDFRSKVRQS